MTESKKPSARKPAPKKAPKKAPGAKRASGRGGQRSRRRTSVKNKHGGAREATERAERVVARRAPGFSREVQSA